MAPVPAGPAQHVSSKRAPVKASRSEAGIGEAGGARVPSATGKPAGRRRAAPAATPGSSAPGPSTGDGRQASGREPHDQKITVYLSAGELLDLERARLALRAYGITVDRGRLVREAIAVLLADLDAEGETSLLAGRLREMT